MPNGGRANDGNGFISIDGRGLIGGMPADGISITLSHISFTPAVAPIIIKDIKFSAHCIGHCAYW